MHLNRKQDLSVFYFLKNLFSAYTFVNIEDGFPENELQLPTISVEAEDIRRVPLELGNRIGLHPRIWSIDVFAKNKAQRDEFAYLIFDSLEQDYVLVYDYDEGFPPSVSPTQLGTLILQDQRLEVVRIFPQLTEKLYWRMSITFSTIYQELT